MARVINIITQMEAGGAQGASIRMSRAMRLEDIDSETWFLYKKTDTYVNEEKVRIIYDREPKNILDVLRIIFLLYKLLKKQPTTGVIGYTHYANVLGAIAAFLAGVKNRVATMRNPAWTFPVGIRFLDKIVGSLGIYTDVITVSNAIRESFANYPKFYKSRISVIYNGVPATPSVLSKEQARAKFNLDVGSSKLLVNVGRLHSQKNQLLLIEVIKGLPGYHFAIAGEGELRKILQQKIDEYGLLDRVHLLGEIAPHDVSNFLRAGDIFLFPSIFEAFGFVIFEAAYNELPVVASNIPSNVEVLTANDDDLAGIIVQDFDSLNWILAIKQLEDPYEYKRFRDAILLRAKDFGFEKMVSSYISYSTKKPSK